MTFSFRFRFSVPHDRYFKCDDRELRLSPPDAPVVSMVPVNGETISEATKFAVRSSGYDSEQAALASGHDWTCALQAGFASLYVAADFGLREAGGGFAREFLDSLQADVGVPLGNDRPGVMVFRTDKAPKLLSAHAEGRAGQPANMVVAAVTAAWRRSTDVSEQQALAYDLFSGSFFQPSPDARFMMLMMSVETLIELKLRPEVAVELVESFISQTVSSGLPESDVQSLTGSLRFLRNESIRRAGIRLANDLEGRSYLELTPAKFFDGAYEIRNRLVHGATPRPNRAEVTRWAGGLRLFAGDLLTTLMGGEAVAQST